ncbi:MAG TPA: hypothetical protein VM686_17190, partial [Polyangiaceae bacterium]|nr:hypothetical protein [Polyangiaceae bacterium]
LTAIATAAPVDAGAPSPTYPSPPATATVGTPKNPSTAAPKDAGAAPSPAIPPFLLPSALPSTLPALPSGFPTALPTAFPTTLPPLFPAPAEQTDGG